MEENRVTPEGAKQIEEARERLSSLPQYPTEWQQNYSNDSLGFDSSDNKLKVGVSLKEKEMQKLIKKYKRYMKNNLTEAKRLES